MDFPFLRSVRLLQGLQDQDTALDLASMCSLFFVVVAVVAIAMLTHGSIKLGQLQRVVQELMEK